MSEPITFKVGALVVIGIVGGISGAIGAVAGYIGLRLGKEFAERVGGPEIQVPIPPPPGTPRGE